MVDSSDSDELAGLSKMWEQTAQGKRLKTSLRSWKDIDFVLSATAASINTGLSTYENASTSSSHDVRTDLQEIKKEVHLCIEIARFLLNRHRHTDRA
jgi:hypothetical protein